MKRLLLFLATIILVVNAHSQQLVTADSIKLVTTPNIKIVMNGGISFTRSTNWIDSGETFIGKNTLGGRENWNDQTTAGAYSLTSTGKINFTSDSLQFISGLSKFYVITVNNDSGIVLNNDVEVRDTLNLNKGYVYTGSNKIYISNPDTNSIFSTSLYANSWVVGVLSRITDTTTTYIFPIGKFKSGTALFAPIKFNKVNSNLCIYTAEYIPSAPINSGPVLPPLDHVSKLEYWKIISNQPSGPDDDAFLTLSWRSYSRVSANAATRDSLLVAHYVNYPPPQWIAEHSGIGTNAGNVTGADSTFGYVKSNKSVGSFTIAEDTFTLGTLSRFNFLPLQLLNWDVTLVNKEAWASWKITDDQNIARYEVEKSLDLNSFTFLSAVASRKLLATSDYSAIDPSPSHGWNYYRLKIIDEQGGYSHSGIKKIYIGEITPWVIYPNPAGNYIFLKFAANDNDQKNIQLFDGAGKLVLNRLSSANTIEININNLSSGSYTFKVVGKAGYGSRSFVKE